MRNYVANPNYSNVANSPFWSVVGTTTADAALADVTQLSVGLVPDDGVNYKAAQVEDLSKLLTGSTTLSVASWGKRGAYAATAPLGNTVGTTSGANGDPFIYVNDVSQAQQGNTVAILEGTVGSFPVSWSPAVSTDDFTSEWNRVRNTGVLPVVSPQQTYSTSATFLPTSGATITANLKPLYNFDDYDNNGGNEYAPTPDNVAAGATATGGTQIPSFYISASGDEHAELAVQTQLGLADWNPDGYNIVSVAVGASNTQVVIAGSTTFTNYAGQPEGITVGQKASVLLETTNMAWNLGTITGVTGSGVSWTITTDLTTSTTGAGSTGLPNGSTVPSYWTLPATALSSTSTPPTTVAFTGTFASTGSSTITVSGTTAPPNLAVGQMVTFASGVTPLTCEIIASQVGGSTNQFTVSGTASGTGSVSGTANNAVLYTATLGQTPLVLKNGVNTFGCELLMPPYYASTFTDIYGQYTSSFPTGIHGAPVGSHYGEDLYLPVQFTNYLSTPVANFQSMTPTTISGWTPVMANGSTGGSAYTVYADSVANIYVGQHLTFRSDYTPNTNVMNVQTTATSAIVNIQSWTKPAGAEADVVYYQVLPGQQLLGLGGVISSSVATSGVGSTGQFTISPVATQSHASSPVRLTTKGKYLYSWVVASVNSANNSFVIYNSSQSYSYAPGNYGNGDSQNAIYQYDPLVVSGAVFDTSATPASGTGVIGLTSNIVGNHNTGTFVGFYEEGPRYIGTSAVGDLETVTPSVIGTSVGGTLAQNVLAGSTYVVVSPNPTSATVATFGALSGNPNAYGNTGGNGGFVPLVNTGTTLTFSGNCYNNSYVISGLKSVSGLTVGQEIAVTNATGGSFPSGTEITAISKSSITVSQPFTGPLDSNNNPLDIPNNTLTATANSLFTVVVGQGASQELVTLVPPSNSLSSSVGQAIDGSTNANQAMIWPLGYGQTIQNDHAAGEIITTPNFTYSAGGSTVAHAQYTPMLGSPDLGTIYTVSGGTDYVQTNALVATNNSNQLAVNAEAYLEVDDPWVVSGFNGDPDISTSLTSAAVEGDTQIIVGDNGGFPTTIPSVLASNFSYLPPTLGLINGSASAGASSFAVQITGPLPSASDFPFSVTLGTETVSVGSIGLSSTGSTGGTYTVQLSSTTVNGFSTTSGSPTVTGATAGISAGQAVSGIGIASNTTVLSVGAGSVTLSQNATATNLSVVLTFSTVLANSHPDMTPVVLTKLPSLVTYHSIEVPSFHLWKSDQSNQGLAVSGSYSSINTTPLPCAIPAGTTLYIRQGDYVDNFYTATGATAGATSVAIQNSSSSTAPFAPSSAFATSYGSNGILSTVGAVITVGLNADLEPEQDIFLYDGTNILSITVASYTPQISSSIPTLQFSTTVPIAAGSGFLAPPSLVIDAGATLEVAYPIAVPTANGSNWTVLLASPLEYDHTAGTSVSYYSWPQNPQVGTVTYRPDYSEFVMWDGQRWRQARVNYVQAMLAILGAVGGRDQTNISLYDPVTNLYSTPDTFSNTLSTAFTVYYGGTRASDPNGNEWTGDTLSNIQMYLKVQIPQSRQVAFRSLGLNVQYKTAPVVRQVALTPADNIRLDENQHTAVSWLYTDLDNDAQAGWEVKIFADSTVNRDDFDPSNSTPFWSATGTDTSSEIAIDASHGYTSGMRYWAYVRVAKKFHGEMWFGDWGYAGFVPTVRQPQPPLVAVYADNANAVNTITIQSTDNLLAPDTGAFTTSLGSWVPTSNASIAGMLGSNATSGVIKPSDGVRTSIPVGAVGYVKTLGGLGTTNGTAPFVVSGNTAGTTDALGFPISGRFWVTIDSEKILVTNKVDGKNSGDTFQIVSRGYLNSTAATHATGSTVTFGLQQDVYTGSNLELSYSERIVKDWTTTNTSVRWTGGSAGVTRTVTTASFQVIGHSNGEKNTALIIDQPGLTRNGWDGQTVTIQYHDGTTEQARIKSVTGVYLITKPRPIAEILQTTAVPMNAYNVYTFSPSSLLHGVPGCHNGPPTNKTLVLAAGEKGVYVDLKAVNWGGRQQPETFLNVHVTKDFYYGDTTLWANFVSPYSSVNTKNIAVQSGSVIYGVVPDIQLPQKKIIFDRPLKGRSLNGAKLLFQVPQTFGAVAATKVVTNTPVKHETVTVVPHAQSCVVDYYTQPATAVGTVGTWNGVTFTPLSSTLSGISLTANLTTGSATATGAVSVSGPALAVGQMVVGYGIQPGTYISAVSGSTLTLSLPVTTGGSAVPLSGSPTYNAFQFTTAGLPAAATTGSSISAPGLPNGATVAGSTTSGSNTILWFASNISDGFGRGAGMVAFSDLDATTGIPKNPIVTQTVSFTTGSMTVVPAGSTSVPVRPFIPIGTFPFGTAVKINTPTLFGDYAMVVTATAGNTYAEIATHTAALLANDIATKTFNPGSIPVVAGQTYALSAWSQVISSNATPTFCLYVDWYDSTGTFLSTSDGTAHLTKSGNTTTAAVQAPLNATGNRYGQGWQPNAIAVTAPTSAYYAIVRLRWTNTTANGKYALSGVMFNAIATQAMNSAGVAQLATSQVGSNTCLPTLLSAADPTNGSNPQAINISPLTPVAGYNTMFLFDPANDNGTTGSREIVMGGSDSFIATHLTASANAGDTAITVDKPTGIANGTLLYLNIGGTRYETVTVAGAWNGAKTIPLTTPLVYSHGANTKVYGYAAGLAGGVNNVQPQGGLVAALNWSYDGYVNQITNTYAYNVQKSVDGGKSWYTLRNGGHLVATGTGFATITDYEAVPGQATLYRALPSVVKNGGKTTVKGPVSSSIQPATPMTSTSWWIADSSNINRRFALNVQNGYQETQKHPSGVFYPLGSSRPYIISGVVQGRDGNIKVIWTDLANWQNFLSLLESGNVLILTNPVESTRMYVFVNQDVQVTHHAGASPWRELEIQYVEVAPPGFGYTYGS